MSRLHRLFGPRLLGPVVTLASGMLLAGIGLRVYWAARYGAVLVGCEYVRIAENLLNNRAYVGLGEGPELMFPPFFPVLLIVGSFLAGSVEGAARLIPVLAGGLLVLVVFALARLVYGLRVALVAAVLTALHPVLIDLSSIAEAETVYLPLVMGGLYWGLRALDSGRLTHTVWCSALFGLAYLTRPEALLYPCVLLAAMLVSDWRRPAFLRRLGLQCLCLVAPILVLAAPYVTYLWRHTGDLRLEGKAIMNYTIGERRNAGLGSAEASLGIGPDLSEDGPQLSPNHFIAATHRRPPIRDLGSYWVKSAQRNKATLFRYLGSPALGSVLAIGLIVLGLFRRPWSPRRAGHEVVLLGVALGNVFLILGLHAVLFRYVLPLMVLSLLWVSKGIDEVAEWSAGTLRRAVSLRRRPPPWVGMSIRCVLMAALVLLSLRGLRWEQFEDHGPKTVMLKEVGTWLDQYRPGPKRVMTMYPQVGYYARGVHLLLPYAEASSLALRYIHLKHPDFIVLTDEDVSLAPYIKKWLEEGIPDPAAELISIGRASPAGVAIYEWHG